MPHIASHDQTLRSVAPSVSPGSVPSKIRDDLIWQVCATAGSSAFLEDIRNAATRAGITKAVAHHDTPKIFDWLLTAFSYQGVSDQAARSYMRKNGTASWSTMEAALFEKTNDRCCKLRSYWQYHGCRYDKSSFTCTDPDRIDTCPVPRPQLRNGRLNQTAYSFYFFIRDIANRDLVDWIDMQLETVPAEMYPQGLQGSLIQPLRNVFGISDKLLTMTLSELLLGAATDRPLWFAAGATMIAIDTLVHNFLYRTGLIDAAGSKHTYGINCYRPGGCAEIILAAAHSIDARQFNPSFPRVFPRYVQHAIWQHCAADGIDLCNGNRIDDRQSCQISYCYLSRKCAKIPLKVT